MDVFLRPVQPSDIDYLLEWENNPENWEVSGTKESFTKQQITDFVNTTHDIYINKQYRYIICIKKNDKPIGCVDLFEFDEQQSRVGVGVLIGDLAQRNKGYATQSLKLLMDYCRHTLKVKCVFCHIFKENTSSIRLFEKSGFQFVEERELFEKSVNYYELSL